MPFIESFNKEARCWDGYEPIPGKKPYSEGSCRPVGGKKSEDKKKKTSAEKKPYTKPGLRERIKKQVIAGGDGGKPGQWSARKAQLVAQKYEDAGGGYKGKKTQEQKSLKKWTKEDWTTSDGSGDAERSDGTMKRYLPRKAWNKLDKGEKAATNRKKIEASKKGQQFVANTRDAAAARKSSVKKVASLLKQAEKKPLKDPEGGLTEAGRRHYERSGESKDLKPGVKETDPDKMSPEQMKRKGSWAARFYGQKDLPPLKKPNGEPTRLALTAKEWGEPVPQTEADARRIAAKGRALLNRYSSKQKKAQQEEVLALCASLDLRSR